MFPARVEDLARAEPVYEVLPGWKEEIAGVRDEKELPPRPAVLCGSSRWSSAFR